MASILSDTARMGGGVEGRICREPAVRASAAKQHRRRPTVIGAGITLGPRTCDAIHHARFAVVAGNLQASTRLMLRKQFLETSRGRIAELLQRGMQTVDAL